MRSDSAGGPHSPGWNDYVPAGLGAGFVTTIPVLLGLLFGNRYLPDNSPLAPSAPDPIRACFRADAGHHLKIIKKGYSYDPTRGSVVTCFPAYPLLSRWVGLLFDLPPDLSALLTANLALVGAFVLFAAYLGARWPETSREERLLTLALFGLWPAGLFLRIPYAEGLFVLGTLAVLFGMARQWPLWVLAVLAGGVTAVRAVGVGVAAAVLWHTWTRLRHSPSRGIATAIGLLPVTLWGVSAYMAYQAVNFGSPFLFAEAHAHWSVGAPADKTWAAKLWSLSTLEPIWGVYDPGSGRYWGRHADKDALFGMFFWNPVFFVTAVVLTVIGRTRGWLSGPEFLLGMSLLAIPYLTRSYEMSMVAHARFGVVVVVQYPVLARLLTGRPFLAGGVLLVCAVMSFAWMSLFAAGHKLFW